MNSPPASEVSDAPQHDLPDLPSHELPPKNAESVVTLSLDPQKASFVYDDHLGMAIEPLPEDMMTQTLWATLF